MAGKTVVVVQDGRDVLVLPAASSPSMSKRISLDPKILPIILDMEPPMMRVLLPKQPRWWEGRAGVEEGGDQPDRDTVTVGVDWEVVVVAVYGRARLDVSGPRGYYGRGVCG